MNQARVHIRLQLVFTAMLCIAFSVGSLGFLPKPSASATELSVPTIPQRLPVADDFGDGSWDCLAAAVAMVLQAVQPSGNGEQAELDRYHEVRRALRTEEPLTSINGNGISYDTAIGLVPSLSDNAFRMQGFRTTAESWQQDLEAQLLTGVPLIVHMSDPSYIDGAWPFGAHAIVVTGFENGNVTYNDPWDGRVHTMDAEAFAQAWSVGESNAWASRTPGQVRCLCRKINL